MSKADILLIEDCSSDAFLFKRAFTSAKCKGSIHVVNNGEEALDYLFARKNYANLQGHLPKVVFLDLKLPLLDGMQVLKKLKSNSRTNSVPVVVLSSSIKTSDVEKAYSLGVNSFIVKPGDMQTYIELVSQVSTYWLDFNKKYIP